MNTKREKPDEPFDPDIERLGEQDELSFADAEEPSFRDLTPEISETEFVAHKGNQPPMPGDGPTNDDLAPEILILEDGANSPFEPGSGKPADERLSIVREDDIGEGYGLDEAEQARVDPLDGKP